LPVIYSVWVQGQEVERYSMSRHPCSTSGFTLLQLLLVVGCIAIIACLVIPGLFLSSRVDYERSASTYLKTICSAEADFRANDRDWNRVNDFWTADVKGLYTMTSALVSGAIGPGAEGWTSDPSIKLIELSLACADATPTTTSAGGENLPLSSFGVPTAIAGCWYAAMEADGSNPSKVEKYAQDTGGTPRMGICHHPTKFGFVAYPDSVNGSKWVFIVNEANLIYCQKATSSLDARRTAPPGVSGIPSDCLNCPTAEALKARWKKLD